MTESNETIQPLHRRMLVVMRLRGLSPNTRAGGIREVKRTAGFRYVLLPANRNCPPIPDSRAAGLRSSP
jgi:hypothetical protein